MHKKNQTMWTCGERSDTQTKTQLLYGGVHRRLARNLEDFRLASNNRDDRFIDLRVQPALLPPGANARAPMLKVPQRLEVLGFFLPLEPARVIRVVGLVR